MPLPVFRLSRCIEHILNKDSVSSRRVIHKDMRYSTYNSTILQNRASAHSLHDLYLLPPLVRMYDNEREFRTRMRNSLALHR